MTTRNTMSLWAAGVSAVVLLAVAGCQIGQAGQGTVGRVPDGTLSAVRARAELATLSVAAPGSLSGYVRDCASATRSGCVFGRPWTDVDQDGCDQRNQVLARDLLDVRRNRCVVTGGRLVDPYTGATITALSGIQIDHVVPLAEMWRSGASRWPLDRRVRAANDLGNLLAVDGPVNQAKGDKTPAAWMPPATRFHCGYARIYVTVKHRYGLAVTAAERTALGRGLDTCPGGDR
jgi:uncharacterized protein DUF1524